MHDCIDSEKSITSLNLCKLFHILDHMVLDPCRTEGVVELLLLISGLDTADNLRPMAGQLAQKYPSYGSVKAVLVTREKR